MAERLFTVAEASALLPTLRPLLESLRDLGRRLAQERSAGSLQALRGGNGGGEAARSVAASTARMAEVLEEIEAHGVVVKDPRAGLIDFPAVHRGAEIYLCWRLEEEDLAWWHPRDTGFAGRRSIDWT